MKLANHSNKLQTNVANETQNFGIGDASVVIDILRNRLYEHKIQTLVQEYICNARDSHRELGKYDNQFEVSVPTQFSPVFKVRDFGPGISPERMGSVFVMYGASTKRGTNNQTGGFGIGAKSAWSYTDSFTIVSIVDGIKRSYVAHTGVNNNGRLDLVGTETTDQPNGTEIQVGVQAKDIGDFKDAILRAIYFWEEKPRLLGILNPPTLVHGVRVGDIEVIKNQLIPSYASCGVYGETIIALIDGVPYPITEKLLQRCPALSILKRSVKEQLIIYIGNGVVEVSASRESIADSVKSIDALKKIAERAQGDLKGYLSNSFAKVKDTAEWVSLYKGLSNLFAIESGYAKYKEYALNGEGGNIYISTPLFEDVKVTEIHCMGRYGGNRVEKVSKIEHVKEVIDPKNPPEKPRKPLGGLPLSYFNQLYHLGEKESVISQNKRVRTHLFDNGNNKFYLFEGIDGKKAIDKLITDLSIKPFDTITYVVLPKEQKVKITREKTQFCMHVLSGTRFEYTTLADNTQEWLYVPIRKDGSWDTDSLDNLKTLNQYLSPKLRICGLAERALDMVKGNKNFTPLSDWLKEFKPSKDELLYVKFDKSKNIEKMEVLRDCKGMKDPALNKLVKEYIAYSASKVDYVPEIIANNIRQLKEVKEFADLDAEVKHLIDSKYPMVKDVYKHSMHRGELVFYINAKF